MARFRWMQLALTLVTGVLVNGTVARAQDITFCSFSLPREIMQAHASFNAIYEFDVDQQGAPVNIKPVEKQFTKLEDVETCLANWRLPQSAATHIVAIFEWQHGVGWTKLAVSSPSLKLTLRLNGEKCPYSDTTREDVNPGENVSNPK